MTNSTDKAADCDPAGAGMGVVTSRLTLPAELGVMSRDYSDLVAAGTAEPARLSRLLEAIDAAVLGAYGLTTKQTQDLLSAFGDDERPISGRTTRRRSAGNSSKRGSGSAERTGPAFDAAQPAFPHGEGLGEEMSADEGRRRLNASAKVVPVREWAGELVPEKDLRAQLRLSKAEVDTLRANADVIRLADDEGKVAFPVDQFFNGRPVKGLGEVVERIGNPRVAWMWLRQPHAVFDARQPLEILKSGRIREVVRAADRDFR